MVINLRLGGELTSTCKVITVTDLFVRIHPGDIGYGKNYFYYRNPVTGLWQTVPWDLDLTWANNMYGNGDEPFKSRVANSSTFSHEYQNRLREIRDLLYNPEQAGALIDEIAAFIHNPGGPDFADANRDMWDYNPILASSYVNSGKAGHGRFYGAANLRIFWNASGDEGLCGLER